MIRLLLENATLPKREQILMHACFKGGVAKTLALPLPLSAPVLRKTPAAVAQEVDQRAIVAVERDPQRLAELMARSLQGNWREELLFVVEQGLQMHDTYEEKIVARDRRIEPHLKSLEAKVDVVAQPLAEPGGCQGLPRAQVARTLAKLSQLRGR